MSASETPAPGPTRLERALRGIASGALVLLIAGIGAYLGLRTLAWPNLERWRPQIEQRLTDATGRPVRVGQLESGFEGWQPWVVARDVAVIDPDGVEALRADRLRAVVSIGAALRGQFALLLLEIDSPSLRVERVAARRLRIGGFDIDLDAPGERDSDPLARLFAHRTILLRDARVDWFDRPSGQGAYVEQVDLAVGSVGRRHRASIHVPALADVAQQFDAALEFTRPPFVSPGDWRQWRGEAYIGARRVDPAAFVEQWEKWRRLVDLHLPSFGAIGIDSGDAAFRAWAQFDPGTSTSTYARIDARALEARFDGDPIPLGAVRAEAQATHDAAGRTTIVFPKLEFDDTEGRRFTAIDGEPMLRFDEAGQPVAGRVSLGRFDAAPTLAWLQRFPLPDDVRRRLEPLRVEGRVDRLAVDWSGEPGAARMAVDVAFENLSFALHHPAPLRPGELRLPGFRNVSGSASLTRAGGRAALHGETVVLRFPGLFAEPAVPFDRLDARAAWTIEADAQAPSSSRVDLRIESLRFSNADAAGEVSGTYRTGGKGAGIVDLAGHLSRADAARTARYLPLAIPARVRDWVRDAVRAGHSDDVRFALQGDLEDFPYRDPSSGVFRVEAALSDARLAYAPGWPAIDRIRGALRFERAGMDIEARAGAVWNVALADTHARIDDFADPLLRVEGSGAGPAQDMIRFVNESALRERIDDFARDTSVSGDAKLQLALEMPLDDVDATKVRGAVRFAGNAVALDRSLPPFEALDGRLEFTEDRLALREMRAKFLGGEVQAQGETGEPGRLQIRARGTMPAASVAQWRDTSLAAGMSARLAQALSGVLAYEARIDVGGGASKIAIDSDLAGVASTLPEPFAKRADERWPLRLESISTPHAGDTLRIALRDDAHLVLEREREKGSGRLLLRRGVVSVGTAPVLPESGFAAHVQLPQLDVDAWRALLDAPAAQPPAAGTEVARTPPMAVDAVSIVSERVHLGGKTFEDVVLGATRDDDVWRASLHARGIDGYLQWAPASGNADHGRLLGRFTQLSIPDDRIDELERLLDETPRELPALDVAADALVLGGRALGALQLQADNENVAGKPVWRVQRLQLRHDAAVLEATGSWSARAGDGRATSAMDFELNVADAGSLLAIFGYRDVLRGGAGKMTGQVRWNGSPMRLDTRSLAGGIELSLGKGQFLKTDPGIAKLIGVLNLQSLRRRLVFDFRDVFAEGFAFDEVAGKVRVDDGVARTDDFRMRGVAAQVRIRGAANIPAETQSLVVEVRPELNAGLASLAYAALANPALGLGSFVAQMVLREPLQQMFSFEYDVNGPWDDPQVVRRERPPPPPSASPDVPSATPGGAGAQ